MSKLTFMILLGVVLLNIQTQSAYTSTIGSKVKLIFSMDQAFGNGIVVQNDQVAVKRIVQELEPLKKQYDVYILLDPEVKDKSRLENTLTTLKKLKMPFVLDVYTSDAYTIGSCSEFNAPYDNSHALSISMEYLAALKTKYGKYLAGLRFMEVFGQDFTVRAIKTTNPEWGRPAEKIPSDNVFQEKYAEQFIKFAKENRMFLQWADFHWYAAASYDAQQKEYEKIVSKLLKKYPGVVTITYNNNEPLEQSVPKLDTWQKVVEGFAKDGAAGYGLSDQSWIRSDPMKTSPDEIAAWAMSALKNGCKMIQFEPVWYFFNLPFGSFELKSYTDLPEWKDRGMGTSNYEVLKNALLKR